MRGYKVVKDRMCKGDFVWMKKRMMRKCLFLRMDAQFPCRKYSEASE